MSEALQKLLEWDRKGRKFAIYTNGHFQPGDGYCVTLEGGTRKVRVIDFELIENDEYPTLDQVILEALRQWNEQE